MHKYRKKPLIVEAFQMTRERRLDNSEWPIWLHQAWQKSLTEPGCFFCSADGCLEDEQCTPVFIHTLEGLLKVSWDDWIIQGIKGELYSRKPDMFNAKYEAVKEKEVVNV